jgi:hypothetical protein
VSGNSNLAATTVSSTLNVSGSTTVSGLNAVAVSSTSLNAGTVNTGNLNVSGPLVAQSSTVQVKAAPNVIASGSSTYNQTFTAPTDGTVLGYCPNPAATNVMCIYWLFIVVAPVSSPSTPYQVGCVGGNDYSGAFPFGGPYLSNPATVSIPVRKGDVITVYSTTFQYNGTTTTTTFYFFGDGAVPGGLSSSFLPASSAVTADGKQPYTN